MILISFGFNRFDDALPEIVVLGLFDFSLRHIEKSNQFFSSKSRRLKYNRLVRSHHAAQYSVANLERLTIPFVDEQFIGFRRIDTDTFQLARAVSSDELLELLLVFRAFPIVVLLISEIQVRQPFDILIVQ